eukprot:TRINITY_DN4843_c0_g1_i1.p1 TRINITY_DN4843_c0_g1~~TRINITY_DN4843_c0_g1_i1.p1  ORF type:complete len:423 (-),score=65.69 TRINITY_DN4843_c0_g1_i1:359-1438(-)
MGNHHSSSSIGQTIDATIHNTLNKEDKEGKEYTGLIIYWLNVIRMQTDLRASFVLSDLKALKSLSLTNKAVSSMVKSIIQDNFWFNLDHEEKGLLYYTPKKIKGIRSASNHTFFMKSAASQLSHITHVTFSDIFNENVDYVLPPSVTNLVFGFYFDCEVNHLPKTLVYLEFGFNFNRSISGKLPASLKQLKLGYYFNQSIRDLPPQLTHLVFHTESYFDHPITNLPRALKQLQLGYSYDHPFRNLPPFLTHLTLGYHFNKPISDKNLPSHLTHLETGFYFDQNIDDIPESILHLHLGNSFSQPITKLPPCLIHLYIGYCFSHPIEKFPPTLQTLVIYGAYQRNFEPVFPPGTRVTVLCY